MLTWEQHSTILATNLEWWLVSSQRLVMEEKLVMKKRLVREMLVIEKRLLKEERYCILTEVRERG